MVEIEQLPPTSEAPELTPEPSREQNDDNDDTKTADDDNNGDEWESLMGEDLVLKVLDRSPPPHGGSSQAVNPGDAVLIDFVGRLADTKDQTTDGPIVQQAKGWLVVVGEGDVLPALEMAVRFLQSGYTGRVWSHSKYAYGNGTRRTDDGTPVPPHSNVVFDVTVIQIVMDTSQLNPYFTIQKALTKKKIANDVYSAEWCPPPTCPQDPSCDASMNRAIRLYTKAAKEMENLLAGTYFAQVEANHPQRLESEQLLLDCLNNIVAVQMKQGDYHKAKQSAVQVLQRDAHNLKALLRAAKASLLDPASTLQEVQAALAAAESEITYKHIAEEKELKRLKVQYKKFQKEYKEMNKAMFGNKLQGNALGSCSNNTEEEAEKTTTTETEDSAVESPSTTDDPINKTVGDESLHKDPTSGGPKPRRTVSFSKDTKPGSDDVVVEDIVLSEEDKQWWKSQLVMLFIQVVLPLGFWFLYRLKNGPATPPGESIGVDKVPEVGEL